MVEEISEEAVIEATSPAAVTESNEEQGLSNEMRANEFDTMNYTKTKLALEKLAGARQGFGDNDDLLEEVINALSMSEIWQTGNPKVAAWVQS